MKQSSLFFCAAQRSAVAVASAETSTLVNASASASASASAGAGACTSASASTSANATESEGVVAMVEGESPESSSESECKTASVHSNATKKRKFTHGNRHRHKRDKHFQPAWYQERDWLKHEASVGMWCAVCYAFRQHPSVAGKGRKPNSLANPSKQFRFRNVSVHANTCYHLAAVGLQSRLDTKLSTAAIQLPNHVIPQAKVLFRTVLFMARHGLAHRNLTKLLELQKANGVKYDLRYGGHYTPVVMHFLAEAARKFFHSAWVMASSRAVMTDEVKQAGRQWVSVTSRLFLKNAFQQAVTAVVEMPGEARDADAVIESLRNAFNSQGVKAWLDDCLVALCVDGASVLLSGVHSQVKQQAPNALQFYCASHRTQRVDFDVTSVPKAEHTDDDAMVVRTLARRLNSVLAKTAKFFSVSTKRWAALRRIALGMGFHVNHGPMRQRSWGEESKRLLKYKTVQKTRYVHWKRWAAHVWLNNLAALQTYLRTSDFPAVQKKKANNLLKRSERVSIVGGMVVYERWAAVLTTLSLATQAQWAVLPILSHTVLTAQRRLDAMSNVLEEFVLACDLTVGKYKNVTVHGSRSDLEMLARWTQILKERTVLKLTSRFPLHEGGLFWGASLFDRRTWPLSDMQFNHEEVAKKLNAVRQHFPAASRLELTTHSFVSLGRALTIQMPPQRSHSGRVVGRDSVAAWVFAATKLQSKEWQPIIDCAIALCTVPLSQTSCEQLDQVASCFHSMHMQAC